MPDRALPAAMCPAHQAMPDTLCERLREARVNVPAPDRRRLDPGHDENGPSHIQVSNRAASAGTERSIPAMASMSIQPVSGA